MGESLHLWSVHGLICTTVLALASIQSASAGEALSSGEPTHEGKSVAYWVAGLEPGRSLSTKPSQAESEEAIHALGPEAIPIILRYGDTNRTHRLMLIRHACAILEPEGDLKLIEALSDKDAAVRETALEVLPKTVLPAALDDVVRLLADPVRPVRNAAIRAMVRLAPDHEETTTALVEALHSATSPGTPADSEFSRGDAALALGALGVKAKSAIPELTDLLSDSDDDVREATATALWKIERKAHVVPVLADCLENARDYQTCVRVMKVLGEIGPAAKSAVPVIAKKIEEPGVNFVPPSVDLAELAVATLKKIDPAAATAARKKMHQDGETDPSNR